jgi:hypothetical protein
MRPIVTNYFLLKSGLKSKEQLDTPSSLERSEPFNTLDTLSVSHDRILTALLYPLFRSPSDRSSASMADQSLSILQQFLLIEQLGYYGADVIKVNQLNIIYKSLRMTLQKNIIWKFILAGRVSQAFVHCENTTNNFPKESAFRTKSVLVTLFFLIRILFFICVILFSLVLLFIRVRSH